MPTPALTNRYPTGARVASHADRLDGAAPTSRGGRPARWSRANPPLIRFTVRSQHIETRLMSHLVGQLVCGFDGNVDGSRRERRLGAFGPPVQVPRACGRWSQFVDAEPLVGPGIGSMEGERWQ